MNLCIDSGNTQTKVGVFDSNGTLVFHNVFANLTIQNLQTILATYSIKACILSSVINNEASVLSYLQNNIPFFIELDSTTKLPIVNKYKSPQTLGKDRIAAAVGANYLKPNSNLLVVDAGSAITYDFINAQNEYIGGNIAPGLEMRLQALHHFTQKLPKIDLIEEENVNLLGRNTEEAIKSGVVNGILFEIQGYLSSLEQKYGAVLFFLTGGNLYYFHNRLNITTFAESFLVLIGLNRILEYNVQI